MHACRTTAVSVPRGRPATSNKRNVCWLPYSGMKANKSSLKVAPPPIHASPSHASTPHQHGRHMHAAVTHDSNSTHHLPPGWRAPHQVGPPPWLPAHHNTHTPRRALAACRALATTATPRLSPRFGLSHPTRTHQARRPAVQRARQSLTAGLYRQEARP